MVQGKRNVKAIKRLTEGRVNVKLVGTDVAARGIDISRRQPRL